SVPALSSPLSDPKPEMMAPERMEPERRQPEPVMMGGMPHIEDNMDTAARVLSLAQQTADQAIADARREADETLGRARDDAGQARGGRGARQGRSAGGADHRRRASPGREPGARRAGAAPPGHGFAGPDPRGTRAPGRRPARVRTRVPQQAEGLPRRPAPRPGSRCHRQRDVPGDGFELAAVDAARARTERRAQRRSGHGPVWSPRGSAALRWFPHERWSALARAPVGTQRP